MLVWILVYITRKISKLILLWPKKVRWTLGVAIGFFWWDVLRIRRKTVYENIERVFPGITKEQKEKFARNSLAYQGYSLIEFLTLPAIDRDYFEREVIFSGLEHYYRAQAENRGVLLLSLHMGNGDMAANMISLKGIPLHLISKKFKNQTINDFWFEIRKRFGTTFIDPHGTKTPFEILAALKKKESVAFVIDQFMGRPYGVETKFFGQKTGTAYGLALFRIKTKAPVVPVYSYRDESLKTHVVFEPEVVLTDLNGDKDSLIQLMTQRFNDEIEKIILKHPLQWMWVHRRWKNF